jgi:hypothetical protein
LGGWVLRQFCGFLVAAGSGAMADTPRSDYLSARTCLLVLSCILLVGRLSTAGSFAARDVASAQDVTDRATTPAQAGCDPLAGVIRVHGGWVLRWGKSPRVSFATTHWDDPNDDETSDDPADDDDGWEGLNALSESEVPVPAWFQQVGCFHSDLEARSETPWYEPFHVTSFLTLQRLRC